MRVVFPAPLPPQIPHVLVTDGQGTNVAARLHPEDDRFGARTCQAPVMESQRTPSSRGEIAPFFVMEVMRAAEERELAGGQVLHLEVGQPSTPAPAGVIEAAHRALDEDVLGIRPLQARRSSVPVSLATTTSGTASRWIPIG